MSEVVCKTLELLAENKDGFVSAVKNIFNTRTMATLKISDLSVGDWVRYEDRICQIAEISHLTYTFGCKEMRSVPSVTLYYEDDMPTYQESVPLKDIHPIPITADMAHIAFGGGGMMIRPYEWLPTTGVDMENFIPAWSLHRLLCLLPTEYIADIDFQEIVRDFVFGSQDMYDEVISCIETLSEEEYFYQEYLEK